MRRFSDAERIVNGSELSEVNAKEMEALKEAARNALEGSFAPYSGFRVGAALLTDDGHVFTGANVENASYGLTMCAERIAVFKAVNAGYRRFRRVVIVSDPPAWPYPCGACRQVLAEFSPNMEVVVVHGEDMEVLELEKLLPYRFRLEDHNS